ncbi:DUF4142 domain-containing protein [Magnetospirillum sp. UT-4]|uniref:DUF4142 domain-containing protein n=1 Tax=Magnetospirillum sp. UT-4 TaxID=2681467 RepID=UPI001385EC0D|nr:DUF4142 domain-containing protein [Magnetospirillum sp. UT-4]CAA7620739.1 conserved exported hypothetical protein [Magnetospirillum sp. UT-4]
MRPTFALFGLVLAAALPVAAAAQDQSSAAPPALDRADRQFAETAMAGNMAEMRLGKLGEERADTTAVRDFASRMVQDHTQAEQKLTGIATGLGLKEPAELPPDKRRAYDKVSGTAGPAFDRAFMSVMVEDHRQAIGDYQRYSERGANAELKGYASETLPKLQEHMRMAEEVQAGLKSKEQAEVPR